MRNVLWLSSLLGVCNPFVAYATLRRSARDIPLDESEGDLPPLNYPEAPPQQRWSLTQAVKAAEQDPVQDPEAAGSFSDEMTTVVDPTEVQFKFPHPAPVQTNTQPSLIASKRGMVQQGKIQQVKSDATRVHPAVVEEFDVVDNGIPMGTPASHGRLVDGEKQTAEDRDRFKVGDFDKVLHPSGVVPVRSLSHTSEMLARTQTVSTQGFVSEGSAVKQKPGPEKMKAQCMSFANYLKAQDVSGPELIRMWKGSCDPIVAAGKGGGGFSLMCEALGGALEPFVMKQNWPADKTCDAVLKVFNEAGIGV